MNASTAINVFARAVVRERRIPFAITSASPEMTASDALQAFDALRAQAKANGVSGLSLEEINEEIRQARAEADA